MFGFRRKNYCHMGKGVSGKENLNKLQETRKPQVCALFSPKVIASRLWCKKMWQKMLFESNIQSNQDDAPISVPIP